MPSPVLPAPPVGHGSASERTHPLNPIVSGRFRECLFVEVMGSLKGLLRKSLGPAQTPPSDHLYHKPSKNSMSSLSFYVQSRTQLLALCRKHVLSPLKVLFKERTVDGRMAGPIGKDTVGRSSGYATGHENPYFIFLICSWALT